MRYASRIYTVYTVDPMGDWMWVGDYPRRAEAMAVVKRLFRSGAVDVQVIRRTGIEGDDDVLPTTYR